MSRSQEKIVKLQDLLSATQNAYLRKKLQKSIDSLQATYTAQSIQNTTNVPDVQQVNLVAGWSIFSTYMIPEVMDIADILSPVIDNIVITKDNSGSAYLPEWNFNGIGDIEIGQAYQIKTTDASELSIDGDYASPEDNPVALGAGWNLIGYLRIEPTDVVSVFFDINATGNLAIVKDYLGSTYLPEWNFNGIGNMLPGAGYQVKTNNADTLQYLSNDSYLVGGCNILYACNFDVDVDYIVQGSCEFTSCAGCTDDTACNYDSSSSLNNGSCYYSDYPYDCDGNCMNDTDTDGVCDELEILGCTDITNPEYDPNATEDGYCLVVGCTLPLACNYDTTADYLEIGLCDFTSCAGCTDETSCSYDPLATINAPANCTYPLNQFVDCDGLCNNDENGNGICDEFDIAGCTDLSAVNYNPNATDDDGSCIIQVGGCILSFACNYDPTADYYLPGSCDFSCLGG